VKFCGGTAEGPAGDGHTSKAAVFLGEDDSFVEMVLAIAKCLANLPQRFRESSQIGQPFLHDVQAILTYNCRDQVVSIRSATRRSLDA